MKKTMLVIFLVWAISVSAVGSVFVSAEEKTVSVYLDGRKIEFDVQPQIIDGKTMVPIRAIYEELGAIVAWDEETQTVEASKWYEPTKGIVHAIHTIGSDIMKCSFGESVHPVEAPAVLIDGRTLIPARAVAEAFDYDVEWDEENYNVLITSKYQKEEKNIDIERYKKCIGKTVEEMEEENPNIYSYPNPTEDGLLVMAELGKASYYFDAETKKCISISVLISELVSELAVYGNYMVNSFRLEQLISYMGQKPIYETYRDMDVASFEIDGYSIKFPYFGNLVRYNMESAYIIKSE